MHKGEKKRKLSTVRRHDLKKSSLYCVQKKQENDVDILNWLSQSPDANLIENGLMKFKLQGKKIWTTKIWKQLF